METKHTKGEWNYKKFDITKIQYSYSIQSSNGDTICKMLRDDSDDNKTEEANAKLIAASPDLLEALMELIKDCNPKDVDANKTFLGVKMPSDYVGSISIPSGKSIHKAIKAINKATK